MKIVTILFFGIAWLECSNAVVHVTHQVIVHDGHTSVDPSYIPPGSQIFIHRVINRKLIKGQFVHGTLAPVAENFTPKNENTPYGNALVSIGQHCYHALLIPSRRYKHNFDQVNDNDIHNDLPEYHAWIRRPPYRGLHAALYARHPDDNMHGYPHIHYTISPTMRFIGEFTQLPFDDLAPEHSPKTKAENPPKVLSKY